jgi:K+-transporting ATPase ATPase C chain
MSDRTHPLSASILFVPLVLLGFGLGYSLLGTAMSRLLFPEQATGSLLREGGVARASALVAQPVADPRYFFPRPSAAGYDPMRLAGSNQSRTNPDLRARIAAETAAVAAREGIPASAVPPELATQSGSGIDPHLSPAAAALQVPRVARARGWPEDRVQALVSRHTEGAWLGLFGEARVNVPALNLALDAASAPQGDAAR